MESHLRGQRNIIVDRREFYLRKQEIGESFDDFLCDIREIAAFCDFCSSCMDNRLRDRIVVGTRDEQALKRMLEEKDLNLQKAVDICRASESANENSATIRGMIPQSIAKVSRYKRDCKKAPNSLYKNERCFRCGKDRHSDMNVCKAKDKKCSHCGKIGHFAVVCRSTGKETPSLLKKSKDSKLKSNGRLNRDVHRIISDVYVSSAISQATPKVQIHITHPAGNSSILWTPDSGAEATVMGLNVARSLGIYPYMLEPSKIEKLCSAGYQTLNCVGAFTSHLSLGDRQTQAEITVVKEVKGALLSWFDSIALGILPEDFPAQINSLPVRLSVDPDEEKHSKDYKEKKDTTCNVVHSPVALPRWPYERDPTEEERAEHAAALVSAFPRVFGATKTLREMHGGPMHIKLSENVRPFAVTAPRTIPYSWRSEIKDQLDELLEKDIICKVEHPTEWCHPIVPVAKKPNGVRLCVDLTKLNKYVCRPTYPVRSPHDAVASISTGASWFSTLDAKMGYFQVKITEEDQDLTCFITPWGRYKFKRAVMGLISSGDEYNRRGDQALGDIPQTVKIVDDVLAYDYSYKDHLAHIIAILQRYFPVPQNITDLRSFMGLVNQLGSFSSVIAHEAQPLRDLLRQRNEWCWTTQHDLSFRRVKEALTAPPVLAHFDATLPTMLQTDASRLHVQDPTEENCLNEDGSTDPLHVAIVNALDMHEDGVLLTPLKDKTLEKVRVAAEQDAEYNSLREIIMKGFPEHCHNLEVKLRPFWNIRDILAVDDDLIVYGA
ncbi:uncharacterized protein LOC135203373 [Macrobrachium nipponense]|uniref:uncharacterized protein LOC135203373 n=1 Tax=Macrobrachium nipponense TaxID=159736 RepID=UPI0030C8893C